MYLLIGNWGEKRIKSKCMKISANFEKNDEFYSQVYKKGGSRAFFFNSLQTTKGLAIKNLPYKGHILSQKLPGLSRFLTANYTENAQPLVFFGWPDKFRSCENVLHAR